ncbi:unnamed protein product, partial [Prorocentrum cordatum]
MTLVLHASRPQGTAAAETEAALAVHRSQSRGRGGRREQDREEGERRPCRAAGAGAPFVGAGRPLSAHARGRRALFPRPARGCGEDVNGGDLRRLPDLPVHLGVEEVQKCTFFRVLSISS